MAWPKKTWTVNGWEDFKVPGKGKPDSSFPADWKKHKPKDNSNYWDVINNPLYEAAANASGIDWDQFVAESFAKIGEEDDYEVPENQTKYIKVRTGGRGGNTTSLVPYNQSGGAQHEMAAATGSFFNKDGSRWEGVDSDLSDWGIDRNRYGGITDDLDTMHEWLTKTIKTHSLQDMPIIERGPQGSDYGIDGDIWAFYGLDKPPAPPKAMEVNYDFDLATAHTSKVTYATPEGYPTLDNMTPGMQAVADKQPKKVSHYTKWQAEQDKAYANWETKWGGTSYGEPTA